MCSALRMPLIEPFVPKRQFEVLRSHSSKSQWLFFEPLLGSSPKYFFSCL